MDNQHGLGLNGNLEVCLLAQQRLYAKVLFEARFVELHSNSFQEFFQKLMEYRYPTFLPVRTYGPLGDRGSDGLCTLGLKLFACYGPQTPDEIETRGKFKSDLAKAKAKRSGEFTTFVFVHNDRIGMHPNITSEIMLATGAYPEITFEQMGKTGFWREVMRLQLDEVEDLLGQPIPIEDAVYAISLADLETMLEDLDRTRDQEEWAEPHVVSMQKLEYNDLSVDAQNFLIRGMRFAKQVTDYYGRHYDVMARDETAAAFKTRYLELRDICASPDEIFQELVAYVVGNKLPNSIRLTSAFAILSYFFQTCDIFESPPADFTEAAEVLR
jgi:hypothetical protein